MQRKHFKSFIIIYWFPLNNTWDLKKNYLKYKKSLMKSIK